MRGALARGISMIVALQIVGMVAVLVGLVTIGVGIPVKEFSFGNTLILSGTVGMCTGLILLGLSVVATELKLVTRRLAAGPRPASGDPRARAALPFPGAEASPASMASAEPSMAPPVAPAPWQEPHMQAEPVPPAPPPPPPQKSKRNLMFESNVRKDRERAAAAAGEPASAEPGAPPPPVPPPAEPAAPPPATFEDAWPKADRGRPGDVPPQRRGNRLTAQPAEQKAAAGTERPAPPPPPPAPPPAPQTEATGVTVLKSGVVDGMVYSLYSDGSIEAQMPEGMMRFASIDELRAHLDQRP